MPTEREVFTCLFVGRGPMRPSEFAREIMILGLVIYYKWDQALSREAENPGRTVTPEELGRFQLTGQRLHDVETAVGTALKGYAETVRPTRGFWYGVAQSVTGAFVYSLLVAAVVLALLFGDVDVPTLLGVEIRSVPASSPPGSGG